MTNTITSLRKIIHIDMDCFYAAVEMRDDPSLLNKPIAVGGMKTKRGVICTCNYPVREYGVHSAMSTAKALQLCPQLIVLPVDIAKYKAVAQRIRAIFSDYSELIEPISLDEAYIDVSQTQHYQGSATLIAKAIRKRIYDEEGLIASAGIASNKLLAKIASDWQKPNGFFVIKPEAIADFMSTLPVKKLWGVGKVTERKLHNLGIYTCKQLAKWPLHQLIDEFGCYGNQLYTLCRGIDERVVKPNRVAKSVSVEHTFAQDLQATQLSYQHIKTLLEKLNARLAAKQGTILKKQFVKVKFSDFSQTTVERKFNQLSVDTFLQLIDIAIKRKSLPIRLLGIGVGLGQTNSDMASNRQAELPL